MAEPSKPTLDYASDPRILPPPNDAIGLPRKDWLNQPARYAALVAMMLPCVIVARVLLLPFPYSRAADLAMGVMLVLLGLLDMVMVVLAIRALSHAGRTGPVLSVCFVSAIISGFFVLAGSVLVAARRGW